ncbi:MAG: hypothetical protein ACUVQ0_05395 [Thermoproteota archaeon]
MACFLAPMIVAIFTSLFRRVLPKKLKIDLLNLLLWGGVLGLAAEHISHREIVPYPPFLTKGLEYVLPEIVEVGVPMTLFVTGIWVAILVATRLNIRAIMRTKRLGAVDTITSTSR